MKTHDVIFIGGPTASGKTAAAIKLAKEIDAEIISADSRQIYIGMDIGTAKEKARPGVESKEFVWTEDLYKKPFLIEDIPHYLIDILYPDQRYTLFDFKIQAYEIIEDILKRGKKVIVAGGTGLYIDALINNYEFNDSSFKSENTDLKEQLEAEAEAVGSKRLWDRLKGLNEKEASKIHPNNVYSVVRALEFAMLNDGAGKSEEVKQSKPPFKYFVQILNPDRDLLYAKINDRVDVMLKNGLIEEAKMLVDKYGINLPALTSLGYKEIHAYLKSEMNLEEAMEKFKQHTRNYAKRQITWFKRYGKL